MCLNHLRGVSFPGELDEHLRRKAVHAYALDYAMVPSFAARTHHHLVGLQTAATHASFSQHLHALLALIVSSSASSSATAMSSSSLWTSPLLALVAHPEWASVFGTYLSTQPTCVADDHLYASVLTLWSTWLSRMTATLHGCDAQRDPEAWVACRAALRRVLRVLTTWVRQFMLPLLYARLTAANSGTLAPTATTPGPATDNDPRAGMLSAVVAAALHGHSTSGTSASPASPTHVAPGSSALLFFCHFFEILISRETDVRLQ
jgi:hypothetical protein